MFKVCVKDFYYQKAIPVRVKNKSPVSAMYSLSSPPSSPSKITIHEIIKND